MASLSSWANAVVRAGHGQACRCRRGASSEEIHISFSCNLNRIVKIPDSTAHIRPSRPAGWVPETWRC